MANRYSKDDTRVITAHLNAEPVGTLGLLVCSEIISPRGDGSK